MDPSVHKKVSTTDGSWELTCKSAHAIVRATTALSLQMVGNGDRERLQLVT